MADNKGIMIIGELTEGKLSSISAEILGAGRTLADSLGDEVICVLLGDQLGDSAKAAIAFGADKVYTIEDALYKDYQTEPYVAAVEKIVKELSPRILLIGQTAMGRDLAPRLSFRLGVPVSMDCLELSINDEKALEMTRSVYGGNARAIFSSNEYPQMATVRQKAFAPLAADDGRKGEVIPFKADIDPASVKAKVVDTVKEEVEGIKLEDAEVIVSGGRGIGNADGFKQLEELAKLLKGAVGASRPPCDNGWIPDTQQVGLTGKIVSPDLYIAVAISGASQHLSGCSGCKNIIAINKDPEANIFKDARYGVVGDWKQVVPALTAKIKELTS